MPPIRVECTTEGMEENWIDVSDFWTRAELAEYAALSGEPFIELWRKKVVACHLVTGDLVIDEPRQVHERIDDLDIRLMRFLTSAIGMVTNHLLALGEANKRLSSAGAGATAMMTKTTPA